MTVEKSKKRKERKKKCEKIKNAANALSLFVCCLRFLGVSANYSCVKRACVRVCATANVFVSVRVASLN